MKLDRVRAVSDEVDWSHAASTLELCCGAKLFVCSRDDRRSAEGDHLAAVRQIYRRRRVRSMYLASDLFGEPAWDMLLELYALALEQRRTSVSAICLASAVPQTTALRWLDKLQQVGLILREDDRLDGRRNWIRLSEHGFTQMSQYFTKITTTNRNRDSRA